MNLINNLIIINQGQTPAKILFFICPLSVVVFVINCIFSLFFVFFSFFLLFLTFCVCLSWSWPEFVENPNLKTNWNKKLDHFTFKKTETYCYQGSILANFILHLQSRFRFTFKLFHQILHFWYIVYTHSVST